MAKDYYKVLGVQKTATEEEIKKAYRKLAHQHHPDKTGGTDTKFKEINEAYQVLSNKEKRAQYDQYGQVFEGGHPGAQGAQWGGFGGFQNGGGFEWNSAGGEMPDLSDIFEGIFGGQFGGRARRQTYTQGSDIEFLEQITLEEAFHGVKKKIRFETFVACDTCKGLGHDKSKGYKECALCKGRGEVKVERKTFFGNFAQVQTCTECNGRGEIPHKFCQVCSGRGRTKGTREVEVHIGAGVEDGQIIKMKDMGEVGEYGSGNGDLYVVVRVKPHAIFERKKNDLFTKKEISITDALLGKKIMMHDIGGESFSLEIPASTNLAEKIKVTGKGMPRLGSFGRGDCYVSLIVRTPKHLSSKAKKLLEELEIEL